MEKGGKAQREPPPPRGSQVPHPVIVSCLRHACDVRAKRGIRQGRPYPPPPNPAPQRAGNAGRGGAKSDPPPPPEGNAVGWGGSGRRVRDEPHDRARGGHAPCKPRRGDHRGCERRVERATTGAARHAPTPCRGTDAAPRACGMRATKGKRQAPPPPPTHHRPPKGGGCRKGGADSGLPSRGQSGKMGGQRGEGARRTTRQCPREASAVQAPAGGAPGERTQSGKGDDGGHEACPTPRQKDKCRAMCQRRACDVLTPEEGQRGRPPLPTPNSHTHQGKGRGQRGDGEGTGGVTVAGSGPPPEDAAAEWGGSGTRVRDEPHRAQREPQGKRGDRRGCNRRKGRVTTGATRQAPPPPQRRDKCRASCLRRAYDVLAQ